MNEHVYVLPNITPHWIDAERQPGKEELAEMRERANDKPSTRWAVAQCVDLGSRDVGVLKFIAIGPECTIKTVETKTLIHWAYYFSGWVNLKTGKIVPWVPQ